MYYFELGGIQIKCDTIDEVIDAASRDGIKIVNKNGRSKKDGRSTPKPFITQRWIEARRMAKRDNINVRTAFKKLTADSKKKK